MPSCRIVAATDNYQIHRSSKPAIRASSTAGIATTRIRVNDATSGGMVLPIAWNMLPFTKMTPDAASAPRGDAEVLGADSNDLGVGGEEADHRVAGTIWQTIVNSSMNARQPSALAR